jgi:D-threo-aldose 1-dehydrogenase
MGNSTTPQSNAKAGAGTIPMRRMERCELTVSALGFGGAPLGDLYARLDEATAVATVETALHQGVTLLDTSPHYGNGLSEHRIGAALRRVPEKKVTLCTKVGRVMDPFVPHEAAVGFQGGLPHAARFDYSYDGTLRSLEQSMLRLGVDHIDIVLIHDVDVWTHGADQIEERFSQAMDGAYRALANLRDSGTVKAIGVGINEADMASRFARAGDFDAMLLAGRYSLLEQPALAEFLPLAIEKQIAVILGGVFNSGILATGAVPGARYNYHPAPADIMDKVARIERVCAAHGVPLYRAALHFALGHRAVASVVLGAVQPSEIDQQIAALAAPVPRALWADLKTERLLVPAAPVPA